MWDLVHTSKNYKVFSGDVFFISSTWHRHMHLTECLSKDKELLAEINRATEFWLHQKFLSNQTTVICLGTLMDTDDNVHNLDKAIKRAREQTECFDREDLKAIRKQAKNAKRIWKRIKPLRDKVFAHKQIISDEERKRLFSNTPESDITDLIQTLLNISNALLQAEINGIKPNFSFNYTKPIEHAYFHTDLLISSLKSR